MRQGFTLIELMIVVLVIGILAAVGIPKYQSFTMESRQRSCMSQLKSIDQAVGVWETQNTGFQFNDAMEFNFDVRNGDAIFHTMQRAGANFPTWAGLLPTGNMILQIVKDGRVFVCPELLQYYATPNDMPIQDWMLSYRFIKISGNPLFVWRQNYVPTTVGRAVTCYTFGFNNNGVAAVGGTPYTPATGRTFYAGFNGPDRTRATLHIQWQSQ